MNPVEVCSAGFVVFHGRGEFVPTPIPSARIHSATAAASGFTEPLNSQTTLA